MKKLVKLFITIVAVVFLVKYCTSNYGSVINLPGGLGGNDSEESSGGWFGQKEKSGDKTSDKEVPKDIRDLEKQLGIGNDDGPATSTNIPSTTTTSSSPLSFKGIPIKGSSSAFGKELVRAGFNNSGNGVYTGDFAGYKLGGGVRLWSFKGHGLVGDCGQRLFSELSGSLSACLLCLLRRSLSLLCSFLSGLSFLFVYRFFYNSFCFANKCVLNVVEELSNSRNNISRF